MNRFSSERFVLVAIVVAGLLVGGALAVTAQEAPEDGSQNENVTTPDDKQNTSYLRVAHAAPGVGAVDVYVDNESVESNVAFGEASEYQAVAGGAHNVTLTRPGQRDAVVFEGTVTLEPRSANTLAASGQVQTGVDDVLDDAENESTLPDGAENETVQDENSTMAAVQPVLYRDDALEPEEGQAALSIIHLSPDAEAIDVTTQNGTVLAENVSYQDASDYVTVPEGQYTVAVRQATPDNDGETIATRSVSLDSGTAYSALGIGLVDLPTDGDANETETPGSNETETESTAVESPTAEAGAGTPDTEMEADNATGESEAQPFRIVLNEDATFTISLPSDVAAGPEDSPEPIEPGIGNETETDEEGPGAEPGIGNETETEEEGPGAEPGPEPGPAPEPGATPGDEAETTTGNPIN
jgi:hypothetical protein